MSDQNGSENGSEKKGYDDMSMAELKAEAKSKNLTPEGNQKKKDTFISALQEHDTKNQESESLGGSTPDLKKDGESLEGTTPDLKKDGESKGLDSPESSEDKDLSELPSTEAQESIFDTVVNKLERSGINIDTLSLRFDGEEALSYKNGDVNQNKLSDKQSALLQSALNDPQNFEGTVTIKSGGKTLLKIENGQVTRDRLGLTEKATNLEVESPYKKHAGSSKKEGLEKTKEVLGNAINNGVTPDKAKDIIRESNDPGYSKLKDQSSKEDADKTLDKFANEIVAEKEMKDQQSGQKQEQEQEKALEAAR